jgi:hypothetical protein
MNYLLAINSYEVWDEVSTPITTPTRAYSHLHEDTIQSQLTSEAYTGLRVDTD